MVKNSFLFSILLLFSSLSKADFPTDRDFLKLPDGRWVWLKKMDTHKTWLILGKNGKSIRNKIWSKFYESDGERHAWAYPFFVRLKLGQFILHDPNGYPQFAIATYSGGNSEMSSVIIYRVLKNRLEIVEERDNFNVAADESVFEQRPVPRDLNPQFKISDIQKWIGKYPFHKVEGSAFFSTKIINDYLKKVLGNSKYQQFLSIEDIGPQTPVEADTGIIHFTVCQKHNCGHMFYFLFKISTGLLFVCEREMNHKVTWFSEKGKHVIPDGICEYYYENKKETDWQQTYDSIPIFLR